MGKEGMSQRSNPDASGNSERAVKSTLQMGGAIQRTTVA